MQDDDRRQYKRRELNVDVRFMSGEDNETTGQILDISEGGLAMSTDVDAKIGDTIIAYPDGLGRLAGKVVRKFEGGIAIQFDVSQNQREYLRKRIEAAVSGVPYIRFLEKRAHERLPLNLSSEARLLDSGETFDCFLIDISDSGAGVRSVRRPDIGQAVQIGSLKGVVRRHTDEGFAIEFAHGGEAQKECA